MRKRMRETLEHAGSCSSISALDRRGAMDGVDDAREFDEGAVAHELDRATAELLDSRVEQLPPAGLQSRQRVDFRLPHKSAVSDDVGGENCGKSSLHTCALRVNP